jgi:mannose/fructose/sorbose-specific phosphotransferase system IIB component
VPTKGVVLYRVDDRLVHGQVVVGWGRHLQADAIVVCSDRAAADDFAKTMMEMGAPADVKVSVLPVREAAERLNAGEFGRRTAIVLVETPADALALIRCGVPLKRLNVGGMHFKPGKRQIMDAVSVDKGDCACLREIAAAGVEIYVQMVPQAAPAKLLDKLPADF